MTVHELIGALRQGLEGRPDVRLAVLFGSSALRGPDQARDVDVAVSFAPTPSLLDMGGLAAELERIVGKEVDLVDLDAGSTLLRWEVAKHGQLIKAVDRAAWSAFQVRATFDYVDLRPFLDLESEGLRKKLAGASWSRSTL